MLDTGRWILDKRNQEPYIQYQESRNQHPIFFGSGLFGLGLNQFTKAPCIHNAEKGENG
jgi:hypothetical protein